MSNSIVSIQPKYRQVKDWIIEQIKSGEMPDGSFLPSETDLCGILQVGRVTVRAAIEELSEENVILKQQGRRSIINASMILNKKRRMRLAWLSKTGLPGIEEIHFQIYNHLLREAEKNDTDVLFVSLQNESDMAWFVKHADAFDGVIITGILNNDVLPREMLEKLQGIEKLAVVDYIKNTAAKYFVSTDNYYGGRMAAEYFLKQKFNNPVIGIRKEKDGFDPIQERVNGFCDCLRENGVECRKLQLLWYQNSYAETYMRLGKFMEKNPDSDAFFCVTDDMAINLMFTLKSLGIRIPNDVSILGFDGIPRAEETYPELATIVQPTEEIAKQTFQIIKKLQEGKKVESNIVMIKPVLRIRGSVRNVNVKV